MVDFLNALLPRLFPALEFQCVPHEGKSDLEKRLPGKLRGWRTPGTRFVVMRDQNGADCREVKAKLVDLCRAGGRPDTLVRIVCRELEAWYLGDPNALVQAFPEERRKLEQELNKRRFRNPDAVVGPAAALSSLLPTFGGRHGAVSLARKLVAQLQRVPRRNGQTVQRGRCQGDPVMAAHGYTRCSRRAQALLWVCREFEAIG